MVHEPTVFVVDDDQAVRESLQRLMDSVGLAAEGYSCAADFLAGYDRSRPGCLLLDIRMPGMDGLELQRKLLDAGIRLPVIIVSGHGTVELAVEAMKSGAVDFIKKPYRGQALLDCIRRALELDLENRRAEADRAEALQRIALLTPREREIMLMLADGKTPKQIAGELGLSRKTVDVHRGHVVRKMRVDTLVDLARMVELSGLASADQ